MNLVPWFPEIALIAGALALIPGLLALRQAPDRPRPAAYVEPVLLSLIALVALDGLLSARTGASFALGAAAALAVQWLADFGIDERHLRLAAWGVVLVGLALMFELFESAAGIDDGGWRFFAQLVAAFGTGSALVTVLKPSSGSVAELADAGGFAAVGAIVVAAATSLVANRVDGVAFAMLLATAALIPLAVTLRWPAPSRGHVAFDLVLATLLAAVLAWGLDPVALSASGDPLPLRAPLYGVLVGVLLGTGVRLSGRRPWLAAFVVLALVPFHMLGAYAAALGALGVLIVAATPAAAIAATVVTALTLLGASHTGSPLLEPTHLRGWLHAGTAILVVGALAWLGKGSRFALLRLTFTLWIVLGPLLS